MAAAAQELFQQHVRNYTALHGWQEFENFMQDYFRGLDSLQVLEAGCGSGSYMDLSRCTVTGIDLSQRQLDRNKIIHEKICGDLHLYDNIAWTGRFDLIVSWDVFEHLHDPKLVLEKFMRWIKPGGRIVIAYSNPQTLKGFVTKWTPLWFHKVVKKIARPHRPWSYFQANTFKTYLEPDLKFHRMLRILTTAGCQIELLATTEASENRFFKRLIGPRLFTAINSFFLGSLKHVVDPASSDLILIIRKPASVAAPREVPRRVAEPA